MIMFERYEYACETKAQKKLIERLIKKFSARNSMSLSLTLELIQSLYIAEKYDVIKRLIDELIIEIKFDEKIITICEKIFCYSYLIVDYLDDVEFKSITQKILSDIIGFREKLDGMSELYYSPTAQQQHIICATNNITAAHNHSDYKLEHQLRLNSISDASLFLFLYEHRPSSENKERIPALRLFIDEQVNSLKSAKFLDLN